MEDKTFFEHYRICASDEQSPQEVSRTGAAINYRAIDTRTHERVQLQLIPLAMIEPAKLAQFKEWAETAEKLDHVNIAETFAVGVEHDYLALVSEYPEGETTDSWIVANGPMAADATLRVGLQVVRALGAAAFFNLTHRAIQPSNLMIVPGQSPDGGWPFVKLLNFGLAGLELHSGSAEARELAPTISPQFASPEQLLNREIDFRSEMYSLGATLCFLLTGAAPLAVGGMKARLRIRRLPELRRAPKALHNLLVHLLREDPENRPQDPVALEQEMRECLTKIERRQAIGRKLGIPLAAVIPRKPKEAKEPSSPLAQVLYGIVAFAILLLAGAAAAEFFFPDKIPFLHRSGKIGVPVGVPDTSSIASPPAQSPVAGKVAANQPAPTASPAVASESQNVPNPTPILTPAGTTTSSQPPAVAQASEPPSPAAAPSEESAKTDDSDESSSTESGETNVGSKRKTIASNRTSTSGSERSGRASSYEDEYGRGRTYQGRQHAQVIGRTLDGRPIMRLPSGRVVILRSRYNAEDVYAPRPRPRPFTEPPNDFVPPRQPFYPPDYPSND